MTGPDSATWDLEIREVTAEDEGTYQCQVLATPGQPPLRSGNLMFTFSFLFLHSKTFRNHIKFRGLEAFRSYLVAANSIVMNMLQSTQTFNIRFIYNTQTVLLTAGLHRLLTSEVPLETVKQCF